VSNVANIAGVVGFPRQQCKVMMNFVKETICSGFEFKQFCTSRDVWSGFSASRCLLFSRLVDIVKLMLSRCVPPVPCLHYSSFAKCNVIQHIIFLLSENRGCGKDS